MANLGVSDHQVGHVEGFFGSLALDPRVGHLVDVKSKIAFCILDVLFDFASKESAICVFKQNY